MREGLPTGQPTTVGAWLIAWQPGLQLRPSTVKNCVSKCKRLDKAPGKVRLDKLSPEPIEGCYAKWHLRDCHRG